MYNRYWSTAGGGEVHAGSLAESLARRHDVELLSETAVDTAHLDAHLGLSLNGLASRVMGEVNDAEFAAISSEYDALFNCTFASSRRSSARHSAYLVYFPPVDVAGAPKSSGIAATAARLLRAGLDIEWGEGIHPEERDGLRSWRWTAAEGRVRVRVASGHRAVLRILISAARPDGPAPLEVLLDGRVLEATTIAPGQTVTVQTTLVGSPRPQELRLRTRPFRPAELTGTTDTRELGVQVERVDLHHDGAARRVLHRLRPSLATGATDDFLETYDLILANSRYTAAWVRRLWGRRAMQLEPPVRPRRAGSKRNVILSVGRFFAPENGHSKRQLEMIGAFRVLGRADWELHLVGGCSTQDHRYLREVERAAAGLPVHLHVNAPAAEVDDLYACASVYWQATGLGEDPLVHPERFEHFGISVVEAMSARAVPVVLGVGGPAASVRNGRDGLHFRSQEELVAATTRLILDPRLRDRLGSSAQRRASEFGRAAFDEKVDRVLARMR